MRADEARERLEHTPDRDPEQVADAEARSLHLSRSLQQPASWRTPPGPAAGMTRIGISQELVDQLVRLNLRFGDWYLMGHMGGAEGESWFYAIPKEAPDEDMTAPSAAALIELLIEDHGLRQEAKHAAMHARAGCDDADRMST